MLITTIFALSFASFAQALPDAQDEALMGQAALTGPEAPAAPSTHLPTVLALGATAYVAGAISHEGIGHGLTCLGVGGQVIGLSLANLGCEGDLSPAQARAVAAGGIGGNLLVGGGSALTLRLAPPKDPATYTFLWLNTAVNLFQAGGYLMVGPWVPVGDWGTGGVLAGVERPLGAQLALSSAGVAMTFGTVLLMNDLGQPLFGRGAGTSMERRRVLTLAPYALGATLVTAGSALNRAGPEFAVSAGVANVAGTLFLAYLPLFFSDEVFIPGPPRDLHPTPTIRSRGWTIAGSVVAVSAVALLGPGLGDYPTPHPLDPR